jgi:hypothetical protein
LIFRNTTLIADAHGVVGLFKRRVMSIQNCEVDITEAKYPALQFST